MLKRPKGRPRKLTAEQEREVAARAKFEAAKWIAMEFGVGVQTVYDIAKRFNTDDTGTSPAE